MEASYSDDNSFLINVVHRIPGWLVDYTALTTMDILKFQEQVGMSEAHPVVPGSSTYRGGGRNLNPGWVSSFSGALSCLSASRWQFSAAFWPSGTVDTPIASQPLNALSRPPQVILIPHIGLPGTTG
jgi:hypothetical protein